MNRTLRDEARALLAVWDDPETDTEDVVAAIERLRQVSDPLNADIIAPIQHPLGSYLLCVWVKQGITQAEINAVEAGMIALSKQINAHPNWRVQPMIAAACVDRIELVGFDVLDMAEAGASRSQESAG